ncbi:MAG: RluA family pseudouridine synthase [Clostridia bacterium]|nr:RluA family pseudouridine synthase [Clostridia bacterium]
MIERRYYGQQKALKKVLPELFPEIGYSEISACIRRRDVKVDGARVSSDFSVKDASLVTIYPKKKKELRVLFEDDNLLACYKPKGIVSEGDVSFASLVAAEKGDVRLMHRLDTNTDGVLLFAKNAVAYDELFKAMKSGVIRKEYFAEVYGVPEARGEVTLDYYYKKDAERGRALISDAPKDGFVPVHLSFSVVERNAETALLRVVIHKGKMHQIRAMLAHYGFFILGDGKYGSDKINRLLGATKTRLTACAVEFSLPADSPLAYLNAIRISL